MFVDIQLSIDNIIADAVAVDVNRCIRIKAPRIDIELAARPIRGQGGSESRAMFRQEIGGNRRSRRNDWIHNSRKGCGILSNNDNAFLLLPGFCIITLE